MNMLTAIRLRASRRCFCKAGFIEAIDAGAMAGPAILAPSLFLGDADFISALQAEPELRFSAEPVPKAPGGVAGNGALARDDLADPVRRHVDLPRKLVWRNIQFVQFVLEDFAGMNGSHEHVDLLSSVIVHDSILLGPV